MQIIGRRTGLLVEVVPTNAIAGREMVANDHVSLVGGAVHHKFFREMPVERIVEYLKDAQEVADILREKGFVVHE